MRYTKEVEVFRTGAVFAKVLCGDRVCGVESWFSGIFNTEESVRRRCEKAHKWADARIATCLKYETEDAT